MVIELEFPFNIDWRKGYLSKDSDGRRRVSLFNSRADRTTISYARYLKSVELGYYIPSGYEVDHINKDRADDRLENLQVLTIEEHNKKKASEMSTGISGEYRPCPACGREFFIEFRHIRSKKNVFCSRRCCGVYYSSLDNTSSYPKPKIKVSEDTENFIIQSRLEGKSDYWIAERIPLSRSKIWMFRKEKGIP